MKLIKKYSGSQYYLTQGSEFIDLEAIILIILGGDDIKVIDHKTGDDITLTTKVRALNQLFERILIAS